GIEQTCAAGEITAVNRPPRCAARRQLERREEEMQHSVKAWLLRIADVLEDWPPKNDRGASRVVATPTGAAAVMIQRLAPPHLQQAVSLSLPVMRTRDFAEAAALIRLSARQLPD